MAHREAADDTSTNLKTVAHTSLGDLQGVADGGIAVFRGVPFAAPAGGENRFKPPQPVAPWNDLRRADTEGKIAPQLPSRLARCMGDFASPGFDEDCLTLKIWTPSADGGKRPVIVWIHGGAFTSGAGSLGWYDGGAFARKHGVVVVGVNYRLGALGFLHLRGVSPGNLGLMDQIAALQFVHDHIAAFGGDPANVTLAGQSAGAISGYALLANGRARTLFRRAILQSGPFHNFDTAGDGDKAAHGFLKIAGVTAEGLRTLPVAAILEAQTKLAQAAASFADLKIPIRPVIDGDVVPTDIHRAARAGAKGKEILLGWTHDEMNAFFAAVPEIDGATDDQVASVFTAQFGDGAAAALAGLRRRFPGIGNGDLIRQGVGDANFGRDVAGYAADIAAAGTPTYLYRFDWTAPQGKFGACHCIELPFVFDSFAHWDAPMLTGRNEAECKGLTAAMQGAWAAFARAGDPNTDLVPEWGRYKGGEGPVMRFGREVEAVRAG